jgi:putative heme iron utilization protein
MSKPLGKPIARPAISEEEKKAQVERFLAQKRESFAINILCNLCRTATESKAVIKGSNPGAISVEIDTTGLVEQAVKMADSLIEKLYPLPDTPTEQS